MIQILFFYMISKKSEYFIIYIIYLIKRVDIICTSENIPSELDIRQQTL